MVYHMAHGGHRKNSSTASDSGYEVSDKEITSFPSNRFGEYHRVSQWRCFHRMWKQKRINPQTADSDNGI